MPSSKYEFLERCLDRQIGWVRSSETRLSLILPLSTALFGTIAAKVKSYEFEKCWEYFFVGSSLALVFVTLLLSAVAVFPRTKGPQNSMIFFGGISSKSIDEFVGEFKKKDESDFEDDLLSQIHINAQIASKKYKWVSRSMVFLFLSIIPWAVSVSFLY